MSPSPPFRRLCSIHGIMKRSGTNYLYRLLKFHPDIESPGPLGEDFLLHNSEFLIGYANAVSAMWNTNWRVDEEIGGSASLLGDIGLGLRCFLGRQLNLGRVGTDHGSRGVGDFPSYLLAKTPSVRGVMHYFDLFPDEYMIVIVRDGRALVESGMRSFGWSFESATRKWEKNAEKITELRKACVGTERRLLIVKYEELVQNQEKTMRELLEFLKLDPQKYDFSKAGDLGVIGSSEIASGSKSLHWQEMRKEKDFEPTQRHVNWDAKMHSRFNWIAGDMMKAFDYSFERPKTGLSQSAVYHRIKDELWKIRKRRIIP